VLQESQLLLSPLLQLLLPHLQRLLPLGVPLLLPKESHATQAQNLSKHSDFQGLATDSAVSDEQPYQPTL
jgi:hypothetical protein